MFVIIGGDQKQYEAENADEVRDWIKQGRADGNTLARPADDPVFRPLSSFPEFADLTGATLAAPPVQPVDPIADILTRKTELHIGECFSQAGNLLLNNLGTLLGAAVLVWLLDMTASSIPFLGTIMQGVLYGGLFTVYLRKIRGMDASVANAVVGFGPAFLPLALAGLVTLFLTSLGLVLCILPGIYLKVAWAFTLPLIVDRGLDFWRAMELSRRISTRTWLKLFVLMVLAFSPYLLAQGYFNLHVLELWFEKTMSLAPKGEINVAQFVEFMKKTQPIQEEILKQTVNFRLMAQFVWLANLPFATAVMMYAYEALFGPRKNPRP